MFGTILCLELKLFMCLFLKSFFILYVFSHSYNIDFLPIIFFKCFYLLLTIGFQLFRNIHLFEHSYMISSIFFL